MINLALEYSVPISLEPCASGSITVRVMTLGEQCSQIISYVLHFLPLIAHRHGSIRTRRETRMHGHGVRPRLSVAAEGCHCHVDLVLFRDHAAGLK